MFVSCLAYTSTLNTEATFYSETSVDFPWTTRRYIPEAELVTLFVDYVTIGTVLRETVVDLLQLIMILL
jgi:hypothetical protein